MAKFGNTKRKALGMLAFENPWRAFRMSLVITCSLALLIEMPAWLRGWETAQGIVSDSWSVDEEVAAADGASPVYSAPTVNSAHLVLAESLGKRYRVSKDALERFVRLAYAAGQMTKVDPLLILAVMAVESSFNPIAESVVGAKGLMQIIPEFHQDKFVAAGGKAVNVLDPETNILAGARVLREYVSRTGDDLVAALRLYGGTAADPRNPYPARVLSERDRLQQILRRTAERR